MAYTDSASAMAAAIATDRAALGTVSAMGADATSIAAGGTSRARCASRTRRTLGTLRARMSAISASGARCTGRARQGAGGTLGTLSTLAAYSAATGARGTGGTGAALSAMGTTFRAGTTMSWDTVTNQSWAAITKDRLWQDLDHQVSYFELCHRTSEPKRPGCPSTKRIDLL